MEGYLFFAHFLAFRAMATTSSKHFFTKNTTPYDRVMNRLGQETNHVAQRIKSGLLNNKNPSLSADEYEKQHRSEAGERPQTVDLGSSDGGNNGNNNNLPVTSDFNPDESGNDFFGINLFYIDLIKIIFTESLAISIMDICAVEVMKKGGFDTLHDKTAPTHKWSGLALEPLYKKFYFYFWLCLWVRDPEQQALYLAKSVQRQSNKYKPLEEPFSRISQRLEEEEDAQKTAKTKAAAELFHVMSCKFETRIGIPGAKHCMHKLMHGMQISF